MIISPLWSVESLGSGLRIKAYETKTWLLSEFQFSYFLFCMPYQDCLLWYLKMSH